MALYFGDYLSARYGIPGHRPTLGTVQIQTMYAVRQKNNRIEYSLGDTVTQTCVRSLFPQMGYAPCWYLAGHATRQITIGLLSPGRQALRKSALCLPDSVEAPVPPGVYWIVTNTPVGLVTPFNEAVMA